MKKFTLGVVLSLGLLAPAAAQKVYSVRPQRVDEPLGRVSAPGDVLNMSIEQKWQNAVWRDTIRTTYLRHNAAGRPLERLIENRSGTGWSVRQRRRFTYDAQNRLTHDTLFSSLGNPLLAFRYTYNVAGKRDSMFSKSRFLGTWEDARRDITYYDANGRILRLLEQNNNTLGGGPAVWVNYSQTLYTTDAQGRILTDEYQDTDPQTGAFLPNNLLEFSYFPNDSVRIARSLLWNAATSSYDIIQGRDRHVYNLAGYRDSMYVEPYDASTGTYGLDNVRTYQYDTRWNRIGELRQLGTSLSTLTNLSRWQYTYTILGTAEEIVAAKSLTLAPNPTSGPVELRYELKTAAPVRVEVLDLLGRRAAAPTTGGPQAAGAHSLSLDARALTPGLYLVRLTAGAQTRQVKLVVQ